MTSNPDKLDLVIEGENTLPIGVKEITLEQADMIAHLADDLLSFANLAHFRRVFETYIQPAADGQVSVFTTHDGHNNVFMSGDTVRMGLADLRVSGLKDVIDLIKDGKSQNQLAQRCGMLRELAGSIMGDFADQPDQRSGDYYFAAAIVGNLSNVASNCTIAPGDEPFSGIKYLASSNNATAQVISL